VAKSLVQRALDIVIPFYRDPAMVLRSLRSLQEAQEELRQLDCAIVAVNDSPGDSELDAAVAAAIEDPVWTVPCRLIRNARSLGFVRSVNSAARQSVAERHDVLLLSSHTVVFPGALPELRAVASSDPFIGFVSPRSNNAAICAFPPREHYDGLDPAACYGVFRRVSGYLPEFHFVPTAARFCLLTKLEIFDEFGYFDEAYGPGYNEESDLIMRANRCGYRAALANHAFVYHEGEASYAAGTIPRQVQEATNAALLDAHYPEYAPSVRRYFAGARYEAERLVAALLPDSRGRLDLLFDLSRLGAYHCGTFEASKDLLLRAAKAWTRFNILVMASPDALRFHGIAEIAGVSYVSPATDRKFAVAFRFGQPFEYEDLFRLSRTAAVNIYSMLDPIADDCLYLDKVELEGVWGAAFAHSDGVIYISDFVKEQFRRRYRMRPGLRDLVAYLSLDYRDYTDTPPQTPGAHILVIGNSFAHKRLPETVDALGGAFPGEKIVALGLSESSRQNVIPYRSGHLTVEEVDELFRGARFVVFPSMYEGFGIPVVRGLAYEKPILARAIPTTCAIKEKLGGEENLILYSSTADLVRRLQQGFPEWKSGPLRGNPQMGWDAVAGQIEDFLYDVTRTVSFNDVLLPRLEHMRVLEKTQEAHKALARSEEAVAALRSLLEKAQEAHHKALAETQEAHHKALARSEEAVAALRSLLEKTQEAHHKALARSEEAAAALRSLLEKTQEGRHKALARSEEALAALRSREAQMQDLYTSWSWRVTAPLRRLADVYLRSRTKPPRR
jgi:GT2 family glycosyltransferase/glycosyltransferase involved in cell wall biosynthesis